MGLSVVSVGRLLAKMGLSPQRPLSRAYQQDPEAVRRWKQEEYPAIAAQAAAEAATVRFADEAGIRSDHHAGTTWAPIGQTPVVKVTGARFAVNMVSAVTAKGALRFAVFEGTTATTTAASFIEFCKRLLHDAPGPVYLIAGGHPSHRAKAVTEFAASTSGRLRLFRLPGCSPQLNPDEWVSCLLTYDPLSKFAKLVGRGEARKTEVAERWLAETRDQLTASAAADLDAVQAAQADRWEGRFADLLDEDPSIGADLRALVEEVAAVLTGGVRASGAAQRRRWRLGISATSGQPCSAAR